MQLISTRNSELWFLLWVIDIFSEYTWVAHLKDKKVITITKILDDSFGLKTNRIRVDKGFRIDQLNHCCKTDKEGKSVAAEVFIRKVGKIYKYIASVSKMCILIN